MESTSQRTIAGKLLSVAVIAVAMGLIEAAVVIYLREIIAPIKERCLVAPSREALPLLTHQQLQSAGEQYPRLLAVELLREPAPLILLAALGWALRRRRGDVLGFFLVGFAIWDIAYYGFLKLLLGWPASLGTWDVLYLIPTAWVAPVWAPLLVSATMLAGGLVILLRRRPSGRRPWAAAAWGAVLAGSGIILASFLLRTPEAFGTFPSRYDWWLFLAGWLIGVAGMARLLWPGPGEGVSGESPGDGAA